MIPRSKNVSSSKTGRHCANQDSFLNRELDSKLSVNSSLNDLNVEDNLSSKSKAKTHKFENEKTNKFIKIQRASQMYFRQSYFFKNNLQQNNLEEYRTKPLVSNEDKNISDPEIADDQTQELKNNNLENNSKELSVISNVQEPSQPSFGENYNETIKEPLIPSHNILHEPSKFNKIRQGSSCSVNVEEQAVNNLITLKEHSYYIGTKRGIAKISQITIHLTDNFFVHESNFVKVSCRIEVALANLPISFEIPTHNLNLERYEKHCNKNSNIRQINKSESLMIIEKILNEGIRGCILVNATKGWSFIIPGEGDKTMKKIITNLERTSRLNRRYYTHDPKIMMALKSKTNDDIFLFEDASKSVSTKKDLIYKFEYSPAMFVINDLKYTHLSFEKQINNSNEIKLIGKNLELSFSENDIKNKFEKTYSIDSQNLIEKMIVKQKYPVADMRIFLKELADFKTKPSESSVIPLADCMLEYNLRSSVNFSEFKNKFGDRNELIKFESDFVQFGFHIYKCDIPVLEIRISTKISGESLLWKSESPDLISIGLLISKNQKQANLIFLILKLMLKTKRLFN